MIVEESSSKKNHENLLNAVILLLKIPQGGKPVEVPLDLKNLKSLNFEKSGEILRQAQYDKLYLYSCFFESSDRLQ